MNPPFEGAGDATAHRAADVDPLQQPIDMDGVDGIEDLPPQQFAYSTIDQETVSVNSKSSGSL